MDFEHVGLGLPYCHEERGRHWKHLAAFFAGLVCLLWFLSSNAHFLFYAVVLPGVIAAGYKVLWETRSGVEVDSDGVAYWVKRHREVLAHSEIANVEFDHDAKGATATVHCVDGRKLIIPSVCVGEPRTLARAFSAAGVGLI